METGEFTYVCYHILLCANMALRIAHEVQIVGNEQPNDMNGSLHLDLYLIGPNSTTLV